MLEGSHLCQAVTKCKLLYFSMNYTYVSTLKRAQYGQEEPRI